jgi:hypothetical protein
MPFNRDIYFDVVRKNLFGGKLTQQQVDGQNHILYEWERKVMTTDLRWLAYPLATTIHETASTMWPIAEYGKGKGMDYGKPDPITGETYYGRGFVQLTWADNYKKATEKLGLVGNDDIYWHADRAMDSHIAADVMFLGMRDGWFRSSNGTPNTLAKYFDDNTNDAYMAREIINGDKTKVPDWSGGVSIGKLIAGYHEKFLDALDASWVDTGSLVPEPKPDDQQEVFITIRAPAGVKVTVLQEEA